jgi:glycosyltransferase involved in cell wall biosynthesis
LNGAIEVIVHDDASTDGSADIIRDFEARYPKVIKAIYQAENQYKLEKGRVTRIVHGAARGKYIAVCEGDDYWTDPLKLQKQVDLLEAHPDVAICFHRAHTLKDGVQELFPIPDDVDPTDFRFDDLLRRYNFVNTATTMFRRAILPMPSWNKRSPFGDLVLYMHAGTHGRMVMLPESMAVWRISGQGAWTSLDKEKQDRNMLRFYRVARTYLSPGQKGLLDRKRRMILDGEATARYPADPRLKRVLYEALWLRETWYDLIERWRSFGQA